jgi:tRNA(adenine34) deaminase
MLAEEDVTGHEAFDRFVRVEESIRPQKEGQSRDDGGGRDRHERGAISHAVLWPRMDVDRLMAEALVEAWRARDASEVPIGAVVELSGEIVGRGFNHPIGAVDPTAHAEIAAMRDAAARVGNYRLIGATLCVTIEPCLMCVGAMVHARIGTLVYGAAEPRTGAIVSTVRGAELPGHNHRFDIVSGVRDEECRNLMVEFFKERR